MMALYSMSLLSSFVCIFYLNLSSSNTQPCLLYFSTFSPVLFSERSEMNLLKRFSPTRKETRTKFILRRVRYWSPVIFWIHYLNLSQSSICSTPTFCSIAPLRLQRFGIICLYPWFSWVRFRALEFWEHWVSA